MWFNMVTFDENELIATRKYVFISNERPKQLFVEPWEGVDFGCQMVLPKDILDEPYANENARRIAILKKVETDTRKDTGEVGTDNAMLSLCGMMAGQGMGSLLTKLDSSPAFASRLSEPNGLEFEHTSFDKGRLRMVIDNDVVTVKMRLGSFEKRGKAQFRVYGRDGGLRQVFLRFSGLRCTGKSKERVYKPSFVLDSHLSGPTVTSWLKRPTRR